MQVKWWASDGRLQATWHDRVDSPVEDIIKIIRSTAKNGPTWRANISWSRRLIGLNFWWDTKIAMLFLFAWSDFTSGSWKHGKLISSVIFLETLTPKSTPPSIQNFLVFWLSLDTRSPVGRGEKLRPKLGIIGCSSLFWRRRTREDRRRSESNSTRPRIGTNTRFVWRFWWGILL